MLADTVEGLRKELRTVTHLGLVFMALYASEGWYETWRHRSHSPYFSVEVKRSALLAKTRALVIFDRVLTGDKRYYA